MAYIRVKTGPNKGRTYEITDAPLTVGREETQTIQILDQGVSRAHAEVFRLGEMCLVRDLNSTNGTYVNDVKVLEETLKSGDELLIGTTVLVFEDRPPSQRAVPEGEPVEFEKDDRPATSTVELKVDERGTTGKVIGQEITSRNITLISQVGRVLRTSRSLDEALEKTLELVTHAIGANQGYLFQVEPSGRVHPRAVAESDDAAADRKVSRTLINRVRQTAMPLLTTDAALDGRFALSESIILKKIKSVICVPVLEEERVEALLYFHSSKVDHTLCVEDLELASAVALQVSMALSLAAAGERVRKGLMGTIRALVTAMEIVDPNGRGHAQRVADYAVAIGTQLSLPADEIERLRLAAMLHDVGKLVAFAPGAGGKPPDPGEHVRAGERILTGIEGFEQILPGVKYHHERADGSGYPYKLKNDDIPLMARIVVVANAFDDAVVHGGPSGSSLDPKAVVKDLAARGGAEFDDDVIKALVLCHRNGSLFPGAGAPGA
ncbi:MAG TPA: HD domain-containing phosphohydrolase [Planctomycetota bacterium]|nr:HD domain-containing phosphohydrolase [Planctomycetota bacterium]